MRIHAFRGRCWLTGSLGGVFNWLSAATLSAPTVRLMAVVVCRRCRRRFPSVQVVAVHSCGGMRMCVVCTRASAEVLTASLYVPDNAAPWDPRPTASPSLSEVAPPIDCLAMPSPSSHQAADPPHLPPPDVPPRGDGRKERPKSPQKSPELSHLNQGRRAPSCGSSGRAKRDGGRSTHRNHRAQPGTAEGEGVVETEPRPFRSSRSAEREAAGSPGSAPSLLHANGSGREDSERRRQQHQGEAEQMHPRTREAGLGESRPSLPIKTSGAAAGRKSTVSPGPWKIPGSDKLPSGLRTGASTLSR